MGNIVGEPILKYVGDQIKKRQEIYGSGIGDNKRTIDEISYLNSRTAWIKLASGTHMEQSRLDLIEKDNSMLTYTTPGLTLAKENVLFGGLAYPEDINVKLIDEEKSITTSDLRLSPRQGIIQDWSHPIDAAYGVGDKAFGFSPMPGIVNASIKSLNRGSLKKATIKIKAHNKNQLDVIDALYMRLGYTVLLEWGNSKYFDNDSLNDQGKPIQGGLTPMGPTLIEKEFFKETNNNTSYQKWLPLIEEEREAKSGNYEALFGIISNFSWTFENDGSYSISIDIMTMGDVIESLKTNVPISNPTLITRELVESSKEVKLETEAVGTSGGVSPEQFQEHVKDGGYIEDDEVEDRKGIENNRGWADVDEGVANAAGYFGFDEESFKDKEELVGNATITKPGRNTQYKRNNPGKNLMDLALYEDRGFINKLWFFILDAPELWEMQYSSDRKTGLNGKGKGSIGSIDINGLTYEQALARFTSQVQKETEQKEEIVENKISTLKESKLMYLFFSIQEIGSNGNPNSTDEVVSSMSSRWKKI